MSADRPYTPETLAAEWQCSPRHIRNLVNSGKLGAFRLGGRLLRIPQSAVEQYQCKNTVLDGSKAEVISPSMRGDEDFTAPWHPARLCRAPPCLDGKKRRRKEIGRRWRGSPRHYRTPFHRAFCLGRSAAPS